MIKWNTFAFFMIVLFSSNAFSATHFKTNKSLNHWMQTYYQKPSPEHVSDAILFMEAHDFFENDIILPRLIGFLTGVFERHPQNTKKWLKMGKKLSRESFAILLVAAWHTKHNTYKKLISKYIEQDPILKNEFSLFLKSPGIHLLEIPLENYKTLNMFWYYYFATGNKDALQKLILLFAKDSKGDQSFKTLRLLAQNELNEYAAKHASVYKFCNQQIKNQPSLISNAIQPILKNLEKISKPAPLKTNIKILESNQTQLFELAQNFLQNNKFDFGKPIGAVRSNTGCNLMFVGKQNPPVLRIPACYFVFYETPQNELELLGEKSVVISIDFNQIGLVPRD